MKDNLNFFLLKHSILAPAFHRMNAYIDIDIDIYTPCLESDVSSYHWIFQEKQRRWSWEGPAGHAPGSAELWPPGPWHVLPLWEDLQGHLLRFGLQRWCQQRQRHRMVNPPPSSVTHASLQRRELHKLRVQVFSLHMCICPFAGSKKDAIHVVWEFPGSFFQKETIRNRIFCC